MHGATMGFIAVCSFSFKAVTGQKTVVQMSSCKIIFTTVLTGVRKNNSFIWKVCVTLIKMREGGGGEWWCFT